MSLADFHRWGDWGTEGQSDFICFFFPKFPPIPGIDFAAKQLKSLILPNSFKFLKIIIIFYCER